MRVACLVSHVRLLVDYISCCDSINCGNMVSLFKSDIGLHLNSVHYKNANQCKILTPDFQQINIFIYFSSGTGFLCFLGCLNDYKYMKLLRALQPPGGP